MHIIHTIHRCNICMLYTSLDHSPISFIHHWCTKFPSLSNVVQSSTYVDFTLLCFDACVAVARWFHPPCHWHKFVIGEEIFLILYCYLYEYHVRTYKCLHMCVHGYVYTCMHPTCSHMWCVYKITGLNFFLLPCKLGNSEQCVILACALPTIHSYNFKVVRQTVWQ